MYKVSRCLGLLALAFVLAPPPWSSTTLSGDSGPAQNTLFVHMVEPGDTLWDLYGPSWRSLLELEENSFLTQPGGIFEREGLTIALIYPGEQLLSLFPPITASYGAGPGAGVVNLFHFNLKKEVLLDPPAPEIDWLALLINAWIMLIASRYIFERWKEGSYAVRWSDQR